MTTISINHVGYLTLRLMIKSKLGNPLKKLKFLEESSSIISFALLTKQDINEVIQTIFKKYPKIEKEIKNLIYTEDGLKILYNICYSLGPLTLAALNKIGDVNNLAILAKKNAKELLQKKGDSAIENLISTWDDFTYLNSMVLENDVAKNLLDEIRDKLKNSIYPLNKEVSDYLATGALREFERRVGQLRKRRAGENLQQAVEVIFDHIGIKTDPVPQHISSILEADLVIKKGGTPGKMCIISCKRTGRERVMQSTVEKEELLRHRIQHVIWFFVDFDQSDERVVDLGLRNHIFYLPDSSEHFKKLSRNPRTSKYVLPISKIRTSINTLF